MRSFLKQMMVVLLTLNVMVYAIPMKCQDILALSQDHSCCPVNKEAPSSPQSTQVELCECGIEAPTLLNHALFNPSHESYNSRLDVSKLATIAAFWQDQYLPIRPLIHTLNQSIRFTQSLPRLTASNIQYKASFLI